MLRILLSPPRCRYLCKALAGRIPDAARPLFADPTALLLGQRCSVLVAPLGPAGTLQDLVNAYLARGQVGGTGAAVQLQASFQAGPCSLQGRRALGGRV